MPQLEAGLKNEDKVNMSKVHIVGGAEAHVRTQVLNLKSNIRVRTGAPATHHMFSFLFFFSRNSKSYEYWVVVFSVDQNDGSTLPESASFRYHVP